mmetsp:Transcript_112013/g.215678  ORF Transcript_112013/g.215678 Transcript_112013/m.215678 type:complete len:292 (-) Transcript_112013:64-939(-)
MTMHFMILVLGCLACPGRTHSHVHENDAQSLSKEAFAAANPSKRLSSLLLTFGRPSAGWLGMGHSQKQIRHDPEHRLVRTPVATVHPCSLLTPSSEAPGRGRAGDGPVMAGTRIEATGLRGRRLSGTIVIDASIEDVWSVITDYEGQPTIFEKLMACRRLPSTDGTILIQQESQVPRLPGLDRRQLVTMRMVEQAHLPRRKLEALLHESKMFSDITSRTTLTQLSPSRTELEYVTEFALRKRQLLFKGPQLQVIMEAGMRDEHPRNLQRLKQAAEGKLPGYRVKTTKAASP